jgi:hypothetical protein
MSNRFFTRALPIGLAMSSVFWTALILLIRH